MCSRWFPSTLTPPTGKQAVYVFDEDPKQLCVRITPAGAKSFVFAGKLNKVIADELNISMRTVEVHRANLFDKMQVKTAVELANLLKTGS